MVKPNTNFELSLSDIEVIENALRSYDPTSKRIQELLGKIHNQKNWYKPSNKWSGGG